MNLEQPTGPTPTSLHDLVSLIQEKISAPDSVDVLQFISPILAHAIDTGDSTEPEVIDLPTSQTSEPGCLRKITLENFQSHKSLEYIFAPRINVLSGDNGAGKSSILLAVLIGLGCKAYYIGYSFKLSDVIHREMNHARVTIELDNTGGTAYEREIYGNSITVTRKLMRNGHSSYQICSEDGMLISSHKSTLDSILSAKFILFSNSFFTLTQDKVLELLKDTSGKARFTCFMKGTDIESINSGLEEDFRKLRRWKAELEETDIRLEEVSGDADRATSQLRIFESNLGLKDRIGRLKQKLCWFEIESLEQKIHAADLTATQLDEDLKTHLKKEEQLSASQTLAQSNLDALQKNLEEKRSVKKKANDKATNVKKTLSGKTYGLQKAENIISEMSTKVSSRQERIDELLSGKSAFRLRLSDGNEELLSEKERNLENIKVRIHSKDRELQLLAGERALIDVSPKSEADIQRQINAVQASIEDKYADFEKGTRNMIEDIRSNESRWHQPPIGPIGCLISLKQAFDPWRKMIIHLTRGALLTFVVCDDHDLELFESLKRRNGYRCTIYQREFESFDFNLPKSSHYDTILDALDFDDDMAQVCLMDLKSIERIIICKSLESATKTAEKYPGRSVFCLNNDVAGLCVTKSPDGAISQRPVFYSEGKGEKLLAGDANKYLGSEYDRLNLEMRDFQVLKAKHREFSKQIDKHKEELKDLRKRETNLEASLPRNLDSAMSLYDEDIKRAKELLAENSNTLQEKTEVKRRLEAEIALLTEELKSSEKSWGDLLREIVALVADEEVQNCALISIKEDLMQSQDTTASIESDIEDYQWARVSNCDKLERLLSTGANGDRSEYRLEGSETVASLETELAKLLLDFDEFETLTPSEHERLRASVKEAFLTKTESEHRRDSTKVQFENLKKEVAIRLMDLTSQISKRLKQVRAFFRHKLALRDFRGDLEFDFENSRLIVRASRSLSGPMMDLNCLSLGENGYVTLVFLLSLWKVMRPRFCAFDEIDKHMDAVNRDYSFCLFVKEILNSSSQAIFITPQNIDQSGHDQDPNFKVTTLYAE